MNFWIDDSLLSRDQSSFQAEAKFFKRPPDGLGRISRWRRKEISDKLTGRGGVTVSTIMIELPADVVPDATTPEQFAQELRLAAAIHWYSRGEISQGKVAQIAGLDRRSFILALGRAGVDAIQISAEELKAEVDCELAARRQRLADH